MRRNPKLKLTDISTMRRKALKRHPTFCERGRISPAAACQALFRAVDLRCRHGAGLSSRAVMAGNDGSMANGWMQEDNTQQSSRRHREQDLDINASNGRDHKAVDDKASERNNNRTFLVKDKPQGATTNREPNLSMLIKDAPRRRSKESAWTNNQHQPW